MTFTMGLTPIMPTDDQAVQLSLGGVHSLTHTA